MTGPIPTERPRRPDWLARLTVYLAAAARQPYAIGTHDCALFAAGAVEAVTGHDPAAVWRGAYDSKMAGLRLLRAAGHDDHLAATSATLPEIAPPFAAPGDIAAVHDGAGQTALGVVQGEMVYVLRETGLGLVPRTAMFRAWRT